MPRPVPYDSPQTVTLTVRQLDALDVLLAHDLTATRLETVLIMRGLDCDAAEDAYQHVRDAIRRALDASQRRANARPITPRVLVRTVTSSGLVFLGGHAFEHPDLGALVGRRVRCSPLEIDDVVMCRVETLLGAAVCVAEPVASRSATAA